MDAGSTLLNSAAFYGTPDNHTANLKLLNKFFTTYPEYIDKTTLMVKGCYDIKTFSPFSEQVLLVLSATGRESQ